MADEKKTGGRSAPSMGNHYEGIEVPFTKHPISGSGPHQGSDPEHYAKHQDHVRENFHGK